MKREPGGVQSFSAWGGKGVCMYVYVCVADVLHPQKHAPGKGEGAGRSIRPRFLREKTPNKIIRIRLISAASQHANIYSSNE